MSHVHHHHDQPDNIGFAFLLNLSFTIVELVGGALTHSVAITADAIHDLGDSISLGLAWFLDRYSQKEANERYTYGYRRYSLLGALTNAIILSVGSVLVIREAVPRLLNPEPTNAPGMIVLATLGVIVNGAAVLRLKGGQSQNEQVLQWHLIEDVLGWVVVLIASIVLLFTDWYFLDPLLSMGIALFIMANVVRKLWQTINLFLQAVPDNFIMNDMIQHINDIEQVLSTHHTHIWSLDGEYHVLTTHIVVPDAISQEEVCTVKQQVASFAYERKCEHVTIEVEYEDNPCCAQLHSDCR